MLGVLSEMNGCVRNGNDMGVVTFGDWTYQAWLIAVKVWMLGRKHGVCRSHDGADFVGVDHGIGIYRWTWFLVPE